MDLEVLARVETAIINGTTPSAEDLKTLCAMTRTLLTNTSTPVKPVDTLEKKLPELVVIPDPVIPDPYPTIRQEDFDGGVGVCRLPRMITVETRCVPTAFPSFEFTDDPLAESDRELPHDPSIEEAFNEGFRGRTGW